MGVQNLWKILDRAGYLIDLRDLEGKRLAIDISIWVIRIIYSGVAMGKSGEQIKNISVNQIFRRIVKLLENNIKPVFVFDGKAPELKKQTLRKRQEMRDQRMVNVQKLAERYIVKQLEMCLKESGSTSNKNIQLDFNLNKSKFEEEEYIDIDSIILEMQQEEWDDFEKAVYENQHILLDTEFKMIIDKYQTILDDLQIEQDEFLTFKLENKVQHMQNIYGLIYRQQNKLRKNINNLEEYQKNQEKQYLEILDLKGELQQLKGNQNKKLQDIKDKNLIEKNEVELPSFYKLFNDPNLKKISGGSILDKKQIVLFLKNREEEEVKEREKEQNQEKNVLFNQKRNTKSQRQQQFQQKMSNILFQRHLEQQKIQENEINSNIISLKQQTDLQKSNERQEEIVQKIEKNTKSIFCIDQLFELEFDDSQSESGNCQEIKNQKMFEQNEKETIYVLNQNTTKQQINQLIEEQKPQKQNQFFEKINQKEEINQNQNQINQIQKEINQKSENKIIFSQEYIIPQKNEYKEIKNNVSMIKEQKIQIQKFEMEKEQENEFDLNKFQQQEQQKQIKRKIEALKEQKKENFSIEIENELLFSQQRTDLEFNPVIDNDLTYDQLQGKIQEFQSLGDITSEYIQNQFEQVKYLLKVFGVPYIESPSEAEAQCAKLEQLGLVDGIITEDSDVFLFGGKNIYRGVFESTTQKTKVYQMNIIRDKLGLTRDKLILLALFLGSDYTLGVKGVGPVNGMEILSVFNTEQDLQRFKEWAEHADIIHDEEDLDKFYTGISENEYRYKKEHKNYKKNWEFPQDFPDSKIIQAYKEPVVDDSDQEFQWNEPDYSLLEQICRQQFDWPEDYIAIFKENMRKSYQEMMKKKPQPLITDIFKKKEFIETDESKRMQQAILQQKMKINLNKKKEENQEQQSKENLITKQKNKPVKRITEEYLDDQLDLYKFEKKKKK